MLSGCIILQVLILVSSPKGGREGPGPGPKSPMPCFANLWLMSTSKHLIAEPQASRSDPTQPQHFPGFDLPNLSLCDFNMTHLSANVHVAHSNELEYGCNVSGTSWCSKVTLPRTTPNISTKYSIMPASFWQYSALNANDVKNTWGLWGTCASTDTSILYYYTAMLGVPPLAHPDPHPYASPPTKSCTWTSSLAFQINGLVGGLVLLYNMLASTSWGKQGTTKCSQS